MTESPTGDIVKALKEIIDKNGTNYLSDEPFQVYTELIRSGNTDRKTVAALLLLLADGLLETVDPGYDAERLSDSIRKEYSINKRMADRLANILHALFTQDNKRKWRRKKKEGLTRFLNEDFLYDWKGFAIWDAENGDVKQWCEKNGFEFVSCDGDGGDDGYEPKFRNNWY